jgi:flagellar biosynthetic protein FliR
MDATAQAIHLGLPQFQTFLVLLFRVVGVLAALPILGGRAVPPVVKIALALTLSLVLAPVLHLAPLPTDPVLMGAGAALEFLLGFVLGLVVRLLFSAFELAGELIGTQMGFGVLHLFDPLSSHQVPVIGQFHVMIASSVFLSMNAHLLVVQAIVSSYEVLPPLGIGLSTGLADSVLQLAQHMFLVALKIAAPVLAMIMLVNLAMAVLGRAIPQINVFIMSFPLTIACGLAVMGLSLPYTVSLYHEEFLSLHQNLFDLMKGLARG